MSGAHVLSWCRLFCWDAQVVALSKLFAWYRAGELEQQGPGGAYTLKFSFAEKVPVLGGLLSTEVVLDVEQTVGGVHHSRTR